MMKLPKSLAAWGTDRFAEELAAEVAVHETALPLERFCTRGGWPTPGSLLVRVVGAEADAESIRISLVVTFDEAEVNACCEVHPAPAAGGWEVRIDRRTGEAEIGGVPPLPLWEGSGEGTE